MPFKPENLSILTNYPLQPSFTLTTFVSPPAMHDVLFVAPHHPLSRMPHSRAFISFPFPFSRNLPLRKRSSLPESPLPTQIRAHSNWTDLSRRAQATLSNLSARDPTAYEAQLRQAVLHDPANPFLWRALAKHLSRDHHASPDPAVAVLAEALRRVPVGLRGGLFETWGSLELRRGNFDLALTIFSDALQTDPFAGLYVSLAVAQMKFHMLDQARETFRQGSLAFPTHPPLWRAWASLESKHGSPHVALDRWRAAVGKDVGNPRAWKQLVQAEQRCGASPPTVAEVLHEALASCPMDSELRIMLAKIEERRKGPTVAKSILSAVEKHGDTNVLRALGRLEFEMGHRDRGRIYFKRAVEAEAAGKDRKSKRRPKERTVRSLHAWALMEAKFGNRKEARRILEQAKDICQTDSGIWRAIAEIESRDSNFDAAREAFRKATELDPDDARLYVAWGRAEALAGDSKRAEMLIDRVSKLDSMERRSSAPLVREQSDDAFTGGKPLERRMSTRAGMEEGRNDALTPEILAIALRERAILASKDGRIEDSIRLLTRASAIEPRSETVWRLLASQQLKLNGIEAARRSYKKGLKSIDSNQKHKMLHWWGQEERTTRNIAEARDLFRKSTCANPDYMSSWMSWGLMEKAEGNMTEASAIFEEATRHAEQKMIRAPFIFQAWGQIEEIERGRADKAADIFQRGVKLAPRSGTLWCAWGLLERRRGNFEKARELFLMSTTADPQHGSSWQSWATLEAQRCNFKKAAELFRLGNENDPSNASLLTSWALMEGRDLRNIAMGRDLFERAVNADEKHATAWHSWGVLEMGAGNYNRARDLLKKASILNGEIGPLHSLGMLEAEHCDDTDAGIRYWRQALDLSPGHALCNQSWALAESRRNNLPAARKIFEEALEQVQGNQADEAMLLQSWAGAEEKHGNTDKARELLRRSVRVDGRRAETWSALVTIEKRRGLREEARQLLREGIENAEGENAWTLYAALGALEGEDGNIEAMREVFERGLCAFPAAAGLWKALVAAESRTGSGPRADEIKSKYEALFARKAAFEQSS